MPCHTGRPLGRGKRTGVCGQGAGMLPKLGKRLGCPPHHPSQGGQWVAEELGQCWGRPGREALEGARLHACNSRAR